jgi:osmotically-inducible protein OsmY
MEDNGRLYTTVMEKLKFEPRLDASDILVAIKGKSDIVVLGGSVKSYVEKLIAENSVKNIPGVRAVADEMKVYSSERYKRSDVDIAAALNNALKWNVMVPEDLIKAVVEDGFITLDGSVEWQHQKYSAWKAVSGLSGVKSVINNIKVMPVISINSAKVKEEIIKEFERNARIDARKVSVEVDGSKIILRGLLRNLEEVDDAIDAAWSIPGVSVVKNELEIE